MHNRYNDYTFIQKSRLCSNTVQVLIYIKAIHMFKINKFYPSTNSNLIHFEPTFKFLCAENLQILMFLLVNTLTSTY